MALYSLPQPTVQTHLPAVSPCPDTQAYITCLRTDNAHLHLCVFQGLPDLAGGCPISSFPLSSYAGVKTQTIIFPMVRSLTSSGHW